MYKTPKNVLKNAQKSFKNFKPSIHKVVITGVKFAKNKIIWLGMSLLAVLGLQGIVVKCAPAIFFCTVDLKGPH